MVITVTLTQIEAARSRRGGWDRAQLAAWGVPWPPPKGWKKALQAGKPATAFMHERRKPYRDDKPWGGLQDQAERDRLEMKRLYQEKSRDYSY